MPKSKLMLISIVCIALLAVAALLILEDKDAINTVESSKTSQNAAPADQEGILRIDEAKTILVPLDAITNADILLDVSENSKSHIAGSVVIPYMDFEVQAGVLKPWPEISKILGRRRNLP